MASLVDEIDLQLGAEVGNGSIGKLARETMRAPAASAPEALVRAFLIYQRAGYEDSVEKLLPDLAREQEKIGSGVLLELADLLISREQIALARHFLETFPNVEPQNTDWFLGQWKRVASFEEIDLWLAERSQKQPFWGIQRLVFAANNRQLGPVVASYQKRLEENPSDFKSARELAKGYRTSSPKVSIDWLAHTFKPAIASQAAEVGVGLVDAAPSVACVFLEQALDWPFVAEDAAFMQREYLTRAMLKIDLNPERDFRELVAYRLLEAYQTLGRAQDAQKIMERMASASPDGYSGVPAIVAGAVQQVSGQRVIEKRILDAGTVPENTSSPDYWLSRGDYFKGRKEWNAAEEAYGKGLALAPPGVEARIRLTLALAENFKMAGRAGQALELLRSEIPLWPPNSDEADSLACQLSVRFSGERDPLDPEDPILWTYLEQRKRWSRGARSALESMAKPLKGEATTKERARYWRKAEALAANDVDKKIELCEAMQNGSEDDRAALILAEVLKDLEPGKRRTEVTLNLFDLYGSLRYWRKAERLYPAIANQFGLEGKACQLAGLAELAARSGAEADALRLWKKVLDHDRSLTRPLEQLEKVKPGLISLYTSLAKNEPGCTLAPEILQKLRK